MSNKQCLKSFFLCVVIAVLVTGCGRETIDYGAWEDYGDDGREYSGENLEGGAVTSIDFDENNRAVIDFGDVTDTESYVLAVYSYNSGGTTDTYQLGSSADITSGDSLLTTPDKFSSNNLTEDFHQRLRELEGELDDSAMLSSPNYKTAVTNYNPSIGSERSFKVLNSFSGGSSYEKITAVLVYKTDDFLAWVDKRDLSSMSSSYLEDLLEPFNELLDDERELFGYESDVDGDGKSNLIFTQVVNKLGGSSGGIVTGFFYAVDLFSTSVYPISNMSECIYTYVPDPAGTYGATITTSFSLSNIHPSVLVHEYQHLINFNMKYFVNDGSPEMSWLNEGLSHIAEDLHSINSVGFMETTGIENFSRISGYLASIDTLCITCGSSLYQRGGSYLFLRHLYEMAQYGYLPNVNSGGDFLRNLVSSEETGVDNIITTAYGDEVYVDDLFRELMGQFGLALFMDNTGLSDDPRLEFNSLNLRGNQDDNRGTVLRGPAINVINSTPMTKSVAGGSISYVSLTADDIREMDGTVVVELASKDRAGAYLIQTGL